MSEFNLASRRKIPRRRFLQLIMGSGILATGGLTFRARRVGLLPTNDAPYRLWNEPQAQAGHRNLICAAVLAANPHNSQPWKFKVDNDVIDVFLDRSRALGPVDPFLRQMHIGVGCAIENLCVTAQALGIFAAVTLFSDPADSDLAARIVLTPGAVVDSRHADVVRQRHTNRGLYYRGRRLPGRVCAALGNQARSTGATLELFDADSAQGETFTRSILAATAALIADADFMRATDSWFRWTPREVAEHADGPSLHCAGLSPALERAAVLGPRQSAKKFHRSWLDATREVHLATAPTFGFIAVQKASPQHFIEAGRLWQRVQLEATLHGLAMQPLDQSLEALERARQRGAVAVATSLATLVPAGCQLAMMFRIGYPVRVAVASARRPLSAVLI